MKVRARRSGLSLVLVGLAGVLFFWLTDETYGYSPWAEPATIDQANQALAGTVIGVVGSCTVLFIGLWLMSRKPV